MKSLKSYLVESEQKYKFRIKMAEKFDDEIMNQLETILEKYEVSSISKAKKTPIQEHPMDFQTLNNAEVFIMDAELNYPVTAHTLYTYITDSLSIPKSHLVVINSDHPEEIAREEAIKEEVLTQTVLNSPEQFKKQLNALYEAYLPLKDALVSDDFSSAKSKVATLTNALTKIDMKLLKQDDAHMKWMQYHKER